MTAELGRPPKRPLRVSLNFSVSESVWKMLDLLSPAMDNREIGYIVQDGLEAIWHRSKDPRIVRAREQNPAP